MRVVLSVESGRLAGRRVWLRENQRLSVGRTESSEFSVRDSSLADVHFQVDTAARRCRLTSVSAEGATFVNGEAVSDRILQSGDIVLAGKTHFLVELDKSDPTPAPNASQATSHIKRDDASSDAIGSRAASPCETPKAESPVDIRKRQPIRLVERATTPAQHPVAIAKAETVRLEPAHHDCETVSEDGSFLAVLKIDSGCYAGRKVWLRDNELMRFGRTELADHVLPGDDCMSGLHFAICTKSKQCWIYDLNSLNGLFVNKQKAARARLQSGDIVRAGRTMFRVKLEGAPQPKQRSRNSAAESATARR